MAGKGGKSSGRGRRGASSGAIRTWASQEGVGQRREGSDSVL